MMESPLPCNDANVQEPNKIGLVDGLRRRSVRKSVAAANTNVESATECSSQSIMTEPRRNPKRKAVISTAPTYSLPDNLLEEALKPLSQPDIEEWEGWVELESEPAFFNTILKKLGVKNIKAQELFTMDQSALDMLPKPVYGLIFLFQYTPGLEEDDGGDDASSLWFANQTTNNACATVALLNIVMNAQNIELGDTLREFKEITKSLSTVVRGYQLSNNAFVRSIHNSFTRRMDHLNADLCLENESDTKSERGKTGSGRPKKGSKSRHAKSIKRAGDDYGFHFIAYVPTEGDVWELDGLRSKPHKIGRIDSSNELSWTTVARPQIEARMLQYEESQLSFNLLALCQSPLALLSCSIARAVASLLFVDRHFKSSLDFAGCFCNEDVLLNLDDSSHLSEFGLCRSDVENAKIPDTLTRTLSHADFDLSDANDLRQQLIIEVKAAMGEYRAELVALDDDEQRVAHRKKEYALPLHKWVQKLAEKGILEELIESS